MKKISLFLMICLVAVFAVSYAIAQEENTSDDFIYEKPTLEKFSQLYWALSKLDIYNDEHIDNFLLINECDIYQEYFQNEFEWQQVREAGRDYIAQSKRLFPVRFEIVQPLFLQEYDFQKGSFEVQEEYKIRGVRRFEVKSENFSDITCNVKSKNIVGYPRSIIIEFSRPVTMENLAVDGAKAKEYLDVKMEPYNALSETDKRRTSIYKYRDAYLVMKVQFFAYKDDVVRDGRNNAQILGVLEAVEVYSDRERENLLFSETYRRRKNMSNMERELREAYENKKKEADKQKNAPQAPAGETPIAPPPAAKNENSSQQPPVTEIPVQAPPSSEQNNDAGAPVVQEQVIELE